MQRVTLGSTGITVNKNGFGALPIQRRNTEDAVSILKTAYENGINFFDTARFYSDSEKKIGLALGSVRENIFIATKTMARNADAFWEDLKKSLHNLNTDYIDIYQFHNPTFCPKPGDGTGLYEAMLVAKTMGKIRHIGFTNHRLELANQAVDSGLYETIQFPFSYLATEKELELIEKCKKKNVGFIAMKALSGGLITDSRVAFAFMSQFDNVLPIWGIQHEHELTEFILYNDNPPCMTDEIRDIIKKDVNELKGEFCRGCGYCMPCPADIDIKMCARMGLLLKRAPSEMYLSDYWKKEMAKIEDCINCNKCKNSCPYGLDTPNLLRRNLEEYKSFGK